MWKRILAGVGLVALLLALPASAGRQVKDYSATIDDFKKIPVVASFFETAHGYAVFPSIGKGGLGIGGSHGKGQVYRGGKVIGFTSTSDISIGAQAGGQAYSQIIFFENADALTRFTGGNFGSPEGTSSSQLRQRRSRCRRKPKRGPVRKGQERVPAPPKPPRSRRPAQRTRVAWRSSPWPRVA
jgi:hypothetical protein